MRIIDRAGPRDNPADRDHSIQYMVVVPLTLGQLTAGQWEALVALCADRDKLAATPVDDFMALLVA